MSVPAIANVGDVYFTSDPLRINWTGVASSYRVRWREDFLEEWSDEQVDTDDTGMTLSGVFEPGFYYDFEVASIYSGKFQQVTLPDYYGYLVPQGLTQPSGCTLISQSATQATVGWQGDPWETYTLYWEDEFGNIAGSMVVAPNLEVMATAGQTEVFYWRYDSNTQATAPTTGDFKGDNISGPAVHELYISDITNGTGVDISALFAAVSGKWLIHLQQIDNADNFLQYYTNSAYTDMGGWWTLPNTEFVQMGGASVRDKARCAFAFVNKNEPTEVTGLRATVTGLNARLNYKIYVGVQKNEEVIYADCYVDKAAGSGCCTVSDGGDGGGGGGGDAIVTFVAGGNISTGMAVVVENNAAFAFNPNNLNHLGRVVGVAKSSGTAGDNIDVQMTGMVTDAAFDFLVNKPVFAGIGGMLSTTVPAATTILQAVGSAVDRDTLSIQIDLPIKR